MPPAWRPQPGSPEKVQRWSLAKKKAAWPVEEAGGRIGLFLFKLVTLFRQLTKNRESKSSSSTNFQKESLADTVVDGSPYYVVIES